MSGSKEHGPDTVSAVRGRTCAAWLEYRIGSLTANITNSLKLFLLWQSGIFFTLNGSWWALWARVRGRVSTCTEVRHVVNQRVTGVKMLTQIVKRGVGRETRVGHRWIGSRKSEIRRRWRRMSWRARMSKFLVCWLLAGRTTRGRLVGTGFWSLSSNTTRSTKCVLERALFTSA